MTSPLIGVRIEGMRVLRVEIPGKVDSSWERVPIAHAVGIPLYAKRLFDERPYPTSNLYLAVRFMSDPKVGLAPEEWQYGGCIGPAPPVLLARADGKPFHEGDWAVLDDFGTSMLDEGPNTITQYDWKEWAWQEWLNSCKILRETNPPVYFYPQQKRLNISAVSLLEQVFPRNARCRLIGLVGRRELNGRLVLATGVYQNGRVGVVLQQKQEGRSQTQQEGDLQQSEVMAVKPENLESLGDPPFTFDDE